MKCPEGRPALLHHNDILTNQLLMFKVSVVSEALRTGAAAQQRPCSDTHCHLLEQGETAAFTTVKDVPAESVNEN